MLFADWEVHREKNFTQDGEAVQAVRVHAFKTKGKVVLYMD